MDREIASKFIAFAYFKKRVGGTLDYQEHFGQPAVTALMEEVKTATGEALQQALQALAPFKYALAIDDFKIVQEKSAEQLISAAAIAVSAEQVHAQISSKRRRSSPVDKKEKSSDQKELDKALAEVDNFF